MGCLFCGVIQREKPATILYQDDLVTAFRDIRPRAPVHFLVVPNEHIASVTDLGPQHAAMLARLFVVARQLAESEGVADSGYRLVINVGRDAGQSVDHLHLHVLGGRPLGWPPG